MTRWILITAVLITAGCQKEPMFALYDDGTAECSGSLVVSENISVTMSNVPAWVVLGSAFPQFSPDHIAVIQDFLGTNTCYFSNTAVIVSKPKEIPNDE